MDCRVERRVPTARTFRDKRASLGKKKRSGASRVAMYVVHDVAVLKRLEAVDATIAEEKYVEKT